ncbi:MAG: hypothetical protein K1X95_02605 [Acidimicrobiia bacterium]|nr:hypothetical protein [Acidimicrobiia bacterium]
MSNDKTPQERREEALKLFVYAPIGAAMYVKDMAPTFINMFTARGKQQVDQTRTMANNMFVLARSLGQARVNQTQQDVRKRADSVRGAAEGGLKVVQGIGRNAGSAAQAATGRIRQAAPVGGNGSANGATAEAARPGNRARTAPPDLAIPDYDSLSATQVAQRLGGLDVGDLRKVREYEVSNRGRKTIVGKIDSLLDGD